MNRRVAQPQIEDPTHLGPASPTADALGAAFDHQALRRPSLVRRFLRRLGRLLVIFCVGVCSTLGWQAYGNAARAMIAKSSPQLGWVAPQSAPLVPTTSEAAPAASVTSQELQQLAFTLAALRKSVDLLTTQVEAGQQQMAGDLAKLRADEQEMFRKLSANTARAVASPPPKPTTAAQSSPQPR